MVRGMARAVFRQDWRLACKLFRSHPLCREHLNLNQDTHLISLNNPQDFTTLSNFLHLHVSEATQRPCRLVLSGWRILVRSLASRLEPDA